MPRPTSPRSLLWDAPGRPRPALTRDDLVRAALELLDEAGMDGLTMRNLAQRLGVQAASLYNHIRDKRDVLTLVADAIAGAVPRPDPSLDWREALEAMAGDYRRVLLAHGDGARVLTVTPPLGPRRLRVMDDVLGVLRRAGLSDQDVGDAGWVFNTYVTGFVLDEQMQMVTGDLEARAAEVATWFRHLPAERFPNIVAVAEPLLDNANDRRFTFGLELLLDGLEARLLRAR
jgi:TetR/AcrR family tetracycline transcriptional repressor